MSGGARKAGVFMPEKRKKVVVVDDEEDIVGAVEETLSGNYSVYSAQNGQEAIKLVENTGPDLIIMDILIPVMDGLEACRRIKRDKLTKMIPVLFLTVKNQLEDTQKAFEAGADSYMIKPFSPQKLMEKVEEMLMKSELRKDMA